METLVEVTSTEKVIEGVGKCLVYGLRLTDAASETEEIDDVTPDRSVAELLAKRFSDAGLYATHLRDAVLDSIS